jgi:hypothetical protein
MQRAKIVLLAEQDLENVEIAGLVGVDARTVSLTARLSGAAQTQNIGQLRGCGTNQEYLC